MRRPSKKFELIFDQAFCRAYCQRIDGLAPRRVNAVCLGVIDTDLWGPAGSDARKTITDRISAALPLGRVGRAQEAAGTYLFATTNGVLAGSVLDVDGGGLLRPAGFSSCEPAAPELAWVIEPDVDWGPSLEDSMKKFDAIVIGTGQSGPSLAKRLAGAGMTVAIIERKLFGGTCVNTGCTPTKALVASAYAAHMVNRAAEFGVMVEGHAKVDMKRVKARMEAIVSPSTQGVERSLRNTERCTVYHEHARFVSPREVSVGNDVLAADKVFVNVGGRASVPQMPGLDQLDYLTNSSLLKLDVLPRHLVIIGGSYIGLEFAQIYRRFGSQVTVIEMSPRLVPREDEDVSASIKDILEREGINIRLNAECITVGRRGNDITAGVECTEGEPDVVGSHLLLAVGRRPNTDDLGLEKAGIATDEKGFIQVDDQLRTNVPSIWALGDCNGKGAFTHTSWNDFEIVAANLLDKDERRVSDRIVAYGLYTDPPLGRAGMTEAQVRKSGRPALIGKMAMEDVGRAYEKSETLGFMKVLIDKETKQFLGASILGTGGDEVVHTILDLMYAKAPYTVMQRAMHIHPTVSEFVPTLLGELQPLE
jgi:pyruvate/2-oxoglutarate dehydrogenase complex dihydrolipoamide dehydrogenase (E3) component